MKAAVNALITMKSRLKISGSKNDVLCAQSRVNVPQDILDQLNSLAHKTYAPATEKSRLTGAGAGPSDND